MAAFLFLHLKVFEESVINTIQKKTVVFVITSVGTGGAQMMLYKLLSRLDRERFEPVVVSLMPGGMFLERIVALNIRVHNLGMKQGVPGVGALMKFRKLLREIQPDVVQGWMYHGNLLAWLGVKIANSEASVFWSIHQSLADIKAEKPVLSFLIRLSAKLSSRIGVVMFSASVGQEQHIENGFSSSNATTILDNFDLKAFNTSESELSLRESLSLSKDSLLVVSIARFAPMKDHKGLIAAAALVVKKLPTVHFVLVGPGVDEQNSVIGKQIEDLGLSKHVHLLGERTDIQAILNDGNIFVLSSSFSESFPNVLGEAMACQVPCVTTDVGDSKVIVGDTGVVVPPDKPGLLADGIMSIAKLTPELRDELGLKARRRIEENFNLDGDDSFVRRYEKFYDETA